MELREKQFDNGLILKWDINKDLYDIIELTGYNKICEESERATNFIMNSEYGKRLRTGTVNRMDIKNFDRLILLLSGFKFTDGWSED